MLARGHDYLHEREVYRGEGGEEGVGWGWEDSRKKRTAEYGLFVTVSVASLITSCLTELSALW